MYDLQSLREMVEKEGFTCAIAKGEKLFTSTSRGVRPLLDDRKRRGFSRRSRRG